VGSIECLVRLAGLERRCCLAVLGRLVRLKVLVGQLVLVQLPIQAGLWRRCCRVLPMDRVVQLGRVLHSGMASMAQVVGTSRQSSVLAVRASLAALGHPAFLRLLVVLVGLVGQHRTRG
jgi:hypothetical protein